MKAGILSTMFILLSVWVGNNLTAQFDDLYFDRSKDLVYSETKRGQDERRELENRDIAIDEVEGENENYDEYSYSSRIRRFHNPVVNQYFFNSFDNWWGLPVAGFMPGSFVTFGSGFNSGFGFSPWNRPWNNWGWNSWSPWYSPWSNNWMGFSGYGNNIFLMQNFYGNGWNYGGWNNWNHWNNGGWNHWNQGGWNGGVEPVNKIYGSRKTGSTSSSVNGRDASPRRPVISGGNSDDKQDIQNDQNSGKETNSERRSERNTSNPRRIFQDSQDASSRTETRERTNPSGESSPVRGIRSPQRDETPQQRSNREVKRGNEDGGFRSNRDFNNTRSSWDSDSGRSSFPSGNSNFGGSGGSGRSSGSGSRRGGK